MEESLEESEPPRKRILIVSEDGTHYELMLSNDIFIAADDPEFPSPQQQQVDAGVVVAAAAEAAAAAAAATGHDATFNEHSYTATTTPVPLAAADDEAEPLLPSGLDPDDEDSTKGADEAEDRDSDDMQYFIWTNKGVLTLLSTFKRYLKEFCDGRHRKRSVWNKVAKIMLDKGYEVTPDACDQKWRNLLLTYRKIVKRDGIKPRRQNRWAYFESIKEIVLLLPVDVMLDKQRPTEHESGLGAKPKAKSWERSSNHGGPREETNPLLNSAPAVAKPSTAPHWFLVFAEEEKQQHEQRMQMLKQMHRDVVQLERERHQILRDLLFTVKECFNVSA